MAKTLSKTFLQSIKDELEALEPVREFMRREAMVYQAGAKRSCAAFNGVAATAYFVLPYDAWRDVARDATSRGWRWV